MTWTCTCRGGTPYVCFGSCAATATAWGTIARTGREGRRGRARRCTSRGDGRGGCGHGRALFGRRHRQSRWCRTLHFRGLVDSAGRPCCGFGFKLYHRRTDACELDVLVLAASPSSWMHGETWLWPPWGPLLAAPYQWLLLRWRRLGGGIPSRGYDDGAADAGRPLRHP